MTAGDDLVDVASVDTRRERRGVVLDTLAAILADAADAGRRFVVVDDGAGVGGGFADDLAEMIRLSGTPCARLSDTHPLRDEDAWRATDVRHGVVLADGPRWRAAPPGSSWDVTIYLRTPPSAGHHAVVARRHHGDGEYGADIVVDYHDPGWPVIRHVSPALPHAADRVYVSETRAFFATRAGRWDTKFGDDQPAYERAVRESGITTGGVVADVGCGTGRALPALRAAVGATGTVIGVDLTPQMLAVASTRPAGCAYLILADARRLPLASDSVDIVFAAGLVQHLPDTAAGLIELARITRPGGRLVIFHPSGRAALAARHGRELRDDDPLAAAHLHPMLRRAGWEVICYDDPPERFFVLATTVAA